jgi:UDP-N-acetylmuramoyl-L-alanyl-D-glutamate--2,6-diaminopimelate ligase
LISAMREAVRRVLAAPAWQHEDPALIASLNIPLTELTADSRAVRAGVSFAAFPGARQDGRKFIAQAIASGTNAVLWEGEGFAWRDEWQVPNAPVVGLRERLGPIASLVYGNPTARLWVVGVAGTNGKTSCSTWIAQAFTRLGKKAAVIGTLGNGLVGEHSEGLAQPTHTTPDAIHLQKLYAQFASAGADCVVMEASSHGLDQGRVNGIAFDVALFTNLSRDHLDYHGDMVSYAAAKARLFAMPGLKAAVINIDDEFGTLLAESLDQHEVRVITYGLGSADLSGEGLELTGGIRMQIVFGEQRMQLSSRLLGVFNAHNLLGVIGTLLASGVALADAVRVASELTPVAGRMQQLGGGEQPLIAVDYAHTPDALEKVLSALRPVVASSGRLICVFGCGGDRDRGKRPMMGGIAARLADLAIVTSDNPRSEAPGAIIDEIVAGMAATVFEIEMDRRRAIFRAIAEARPGDVVLIAGKGHELYQEIQGVRHPFNDVEVASKALAERNRGKA